jgi:hypothetical protein
VWSNFGCGCAGLLTLVSELSQNRGARNPVDEVSTASVTMPRSTLTGSIFTAILQPMIGQRDRHIVGTGRYRCRACKFTHRTDEYQNDKICVPGYRQTKGPETMLVVRLQTALDCPSCACFGWTFLSIGHGISIRFTVNQSGVNQIVVLWV